MARKSPARLDHRPLLKDRRVKSWFDGNALRSERTADVLLRQVGLFCHEIGTTPASLVVMAREEPDKLRDKIVGYTTELLKTRSRKESYVKKTFSGVKSWLKFCGVSFTQYPALRLRHSSGKAVPTPEELRRVLDALGPRGRASALLMAHSGVRPGVLAAYRGDDGLTLWDLPELDIGRIEFKTVPFLIRVPARLSKTGREYVTFGTEEAGRALVAYLSDRKTRRREKLSGKSPVIAGIGSDSANGFVTEKALAKDLRDGLRSALPDKELPPYILRSYCSSQLWLAGTKGLIDPDTREAILGHDLGVSGRYNLSRQLRVEQIDEMRKSYKRCEPFLSTVPTKTAGIDVIQREAAVLLLTGLHGRTEEEARGMVENKSGPELAELLRPPATKGGARAGIERAVPIEQVPGLLDGGWQFVSSLNSSLAILRSPPEWLHLNDLGTPVGAARSSVVVSEASGSTLG